MMLRLALLLCLVASPALADWWPRGKTNPLDRVLTKEQAILRQNGLAAYAPNYACDYTKGRLCGGENWYRRLSSNWTFRNAAGYITYAPNQLYTNSAAPDTTPRVIATDGNGKYILKCSGNGRLDYSGSATGQRTCPGEVLLSPGSGTITLTIGTGAPTSVRFSEVMHETTLPAYDNFDQGSVAWQPARIDSNGWLIEGVIPNCCPEGLTTWPLISNLLLWSNALSGSYYSPASADTTVAAAPSIISPDGTANAWRVANVANANDGLSVTNPVTVTSNKPYAYSLHIKRDNAIWVMLDFLDPAGPTNYRAWFNLQTGAAGTSCGSCAVGIFPDPSGNGWYRISVGIANYAATSVKPTLKLVAGDNTTTGCVCAAWVYGWQLDDRGAGPFSYTPTNGYVAAREPERANSTDLRIAGPLSFVIEMGSKPQQLYGATGDTVLIAFNSGVSIGPECGINMWCSNNLTNLGFGLKTTGAMTSSYNSVATSNVADWSRRNRFAFSMGVRGVRFAMNGGDAVYGNRAEEFGEPIAHVWLDSLGGYVRYLATYQNLLPATVLKEKSKRQ